MRAVYLLTAYADLLRIDQDAVDSERSIAVRRLWNSMVQRKMYVTGGIGAIRQWEGFGGDFFLPQSLDEGGCYSETCAAIGVMMWAQRLLTVSAACLRRLLSPFYGCQWRCSSADCTCPGSWSWTAESGTSWNCAYTTPS